MIRLALGNHNGHHGHKGLAYPVFVSFVSFVVNAYGAQKGQSLLGADPDIGDERQMVRGDQR